MSLEILISIFIKGSSSKYLWYAGSVSCLGTLNPGCQRHWRVLTLILVGYLALFCHFSGMPAASQQPEFGNCNKINGNSMCRVGNQDRNHCVILIWDLALLAIKTFIDIYPLKVSLCWWGCLPHSKNMAGVCSALNDLQLQGLSKSSKQFPGMEKSYYVLISLNC